MLAGHRRPVCADYHRRERRIPQRRQQLLRALQRPARAERGPEQAATERDQQPGAEQTEAAVGSLDPVLAGADRSEVQTSELQSLMRIAYAVFCLKKIIIKET